VADSDTLRFPTGEADMSNCPHCNRATFEIEQVEVDGEQLQLLQCSGCKAPICVVEFTVGSRIHDLEQRLTEVLRVLVSSLQKMSAKFDDIERARGK
jgi:hypothetical protein